MIQAQIRIQKRGGREGMNIQWYPGHMTKTRRMIAENLKFVDVVAEVIDARIPIASRNPDIDELVGEKPRVVILNRADQADPAASKAWGAYYRAQGMYVEELVALGKIKRGSRDYQEKKNIITRAIGTAETVDIDLFALKLKPKDYILMCSDGLSNMVDEFEMEYIIRSEENMKQKVEVLVDAANRSGGKDNISVVLIEPQISEVIL